MNLLSAADLSEAQIRGFFARASALREQWKSTGRVDQTLSGKTIVNLFFENSTRTRSSFEIAIRRLGGGALNIAAATSSVQKGETLIDTAQNLQALGPHAIVIRHASAGSPAVLARALKIPIINAGDGFHEHPTQALLDAFTLRERIGELAGKRVLIVGDVAHSRVARSNIHLLKTLGATVEIAGPPTLLPPSPEALGVRAHYRLDQCLPEADAVMLLRVQLERQNRMQIPSLREYARIWGLTAERARKLLKPHAVLLHPGPVNRGVEMDPDVADSDRSLILDQVENGVWIRMAVLEGVTA